MAIKLPDPRMVAKEEANRILAAPELWLKSPIQRVLADAFFVEPESLIGGLEAYHKEAMSKVPSVAKYPESKAWVEHILAVDAELKRLANLTDRDMAVLRSLWNYITFRGFIQAKPRAITREKCRVVYLPDSNHGAFHAKNVDDPPTHWNPKAAKAVPRVYSDGLIWDGVGSGLHIDDEPADIFPLPVPAMWKTHCSDIPGSVEFITRYSSFHSGGNFVLHDQKGNSVAIEKCSRNFIEVFKPDAKTGESHVSGMVCRDPKSPQGKFQKAKRDQYLKMFKQPKDGPDQTFWNACDKAETMLAKGIAKAGKAAGGKTSCEEILALMTTPWPKGLNKCGAKLHPKQSVGEYTLLTHAAYMDEGVYLRWVRDEKLKYPAEPEVFKI